MGNQKAFFLMKRPQSAALNMSLDILTSIYTTGLSVVPSAPTADMIDAALQAGARSREDAENIYHAMISANA